MQRPASTVSPRLRPLPAKHQIRHIVGSGAWAALCCVAAAAGAAAATATAACDVRIDSETYRKETVASDVYRPIGLAVDYTTNVLYFNNGSQFSMKLDLATGALSEIRELTGDCAFAVDRAHDEVHAGCRGDHDGHGAGLYQLDSNVGRFVRAGEAGHRVEFVHFNNVLYYSVDDSLLLHTFRKGHRVRAHDVAAQVWDLVIDKHNDWIFCDRAAVYWQQAGAAGPTRYEGVEHPRDLAVDANGTAFVCDYRTGIYRLHERPPRATTLLDVKCFGLTFDRDNNLIYGDGQDRIVRLVKC